jgi:RNA-binding protein
MQPLNSSHAKYLRGLSHGVKPVVFIGQRGLTPAVVDSIHQALSAHELIKIKFVDQKEKRLKQECAAQIERLTASRMAGMVGHTAVFYRPHPDPEKRKIALPRGAGPQGGLTRPQARSPQRRRH